MGAQKGKEMSRLIEFRPGVLARVGETQTDESGREWRFGDDGRWTSVGGGPPPPELASGETRTREHPRFTVGLQWGHGRKSEKPSEKYRKAKKDRQGG